MFYRRKYGDHAITAKQLLVKGKRAHGRSVWKSVGVGNDRVEYRFDRPTASFLTPQDFRHTARLRMTEHKAKKPHVEDVIGVERQSAYFVSRAGV